LSQAVKPAHIRYGLQTMESIAKTTIGWGLVSEAYAISFIWAVIVGWRAVRAICGALMRSASALRQLTADVPSTIAATWYC